MGEVRIDGVPLVWLQRAANPQYGRDRYSLELLCPDRDVTDRFLARVHAADGRAQHPARAGDLLRRRTLRLPRRGRGLTFLRRPEVTAAEVILPEGVRERVVRHVVGIGEQREALRQAGQHLKRGVLLYGPPGTGKTHLVRHLLSQTPGTTAVLLSGRTLDLLNHATALARAAQPAIVVLEDCDLVAEHRGGETNAALFETLEAMDGLAADADITFILTTNRADLLERALVERPGRVDLAVEIAKPDHEGRERLFRLYAADLLAAGQLSESAVHTAAARTEGVTASFTKELIRRCVVNAALAGRAAGGRRRVARAGRDAVRRRGPDPDPARRRGRLLPRAGRGIDPRPTRTPRTAAGSRPARLRLVDLLRGLRVENSTNGEISPSDRRTEGEKSPLVEFLTNGSECGAHADLQLGEPAAELEDRAAVLERDADVVGGLLHLGRSVADGHAAAGPAEHLDVVAAVAEGQHVGGGMPSPAATSASAVALFTPAGAMSSQALQPTK